MNPFITHGAISWPELMTSDPEAAAKFYSTVFGWTVDTMQMPTGEYRVAKVGDGPMCGIMKKPDPGMPDFWGFYVTVNDARETIKQATRLGATVIQPPMEIPTVGTVAGITDPQGAVIMVMTPESSDENNPHNDFAKWFQKHGMFSWFELRTPDPVAATEFYSTLFGWTVKRDDMGMGPYYMVSVGETGIGGIINLPQAEMPPHWGAYVTVDDVDATAKQIKSSGGTPMMEPFDIPKVGRFAMFQDPTGAVLSAITYLSVEAM